MGSQRQIDVVELGARLGGVLPAAYTELVRTEEASVLQSRGFDPKTLLVLNLQMRFWNHVDWNGKFFLNGDGCGNYYFAELTSAAHRVLLWSHESSGVEDPDEELGTYLRQAEQTDRIDWPVRPGVLFICRSAAYAESILEPIALDEWIDAVEETDGIAHVGYREGRNPFTGETIRVESPGLARVDGSRRADVSFYYGRAELPESPQHRSVAETLASKLHARLIGDDLGWTDA